MLKIPDFQTPQNRLRTRIRKKLLDVFDVNYAVSEIRIDTWEAFENELYIPFSAGNKIYYRGERMVNAKRRLVPTLLRDNELFAPKDNRPIFEINCQSMLDFYCSKPTFKTVYETLYGKAERENMYPMLAFAQHYLDLSPFIDFTKSLYVALSFAMKGRESFDDDIVVFTAFDIGDDDTTESVDEVNRWLENYRVNIVRMDMEEELRKKSEEFKKEGVRPEQLRKDLKTLQEIVEQMTPTAKLIDIPTNDLMKYQQGVFLLLNNFSLIDSKYLTKSVRQSFVINKYVLSREICPQLQTFVMEKAPQYRYDCLLDISRAVREEK